MAYRQSARQVVDESRLILGHLRSSPCELVIALETSCRQPRDATLCSISPGELQAMLLRLRQELRRYPSFSGLAVHQYTDWPAATGVGDRAAGANGAPTVILVHPTEDGVHMEAYAIHLEAVSQDPDLWVTNLIDWYRSYRNQGMRSEFPEATEP